MMNLLTRSRMRLQLAAKGHRVIGEYYRPILSSIHTAGATINVAIDPVFEALKLLSSTPEKLSPPTLDYTSRIFPDLYDSDALTREAIWRIVLASKPEIVVETGVANGLSSQTILLALEENRHGLLYSFDVDPRVVDSVPAKLKSRWIFTLLNRRSAMSELKAAVLPLGGKIGVWFHDSDHNFSWQKEEFNLAANLLEPEGILISDDVDGTEAFANFCTEHPRWHSSALFDTRKVCGFSRKPKFG